MKANQTSPSEDDGIHLNIGCGNKIWEGFINIDFPGNWSGKKPDIECDVRSLPFHDEYADTAYAIHILEHFHRWETEKTLAEWRRVLKTGGKMVIEVPSLDRVLLVFIEAMASGDKKPICEQKTMWRLYGDPRYKDENMMHKWCFSANELISVMQSVGFRDVSVSSPHFHHPDVDMRVTGIK